MRVVITGGGTGGHLSVANAFLEEFAKRGFSCAFIGSKKGQDQMYFHQEEKLTQKDFLETSGVVNQQGLKFFKALWLQFRAFLQAYKILKEFQPDFVLSVGGYSAAPAAFSATLLRIPLIIHEQNAKMGRLNKILKPFAKIFFSSYLESSPIRFYPTSEAFFTQARIRENIKNLLFMGGSQGAKSINDFALSVAQDLKNSKFKILHQCGTKDLERVTSEYLEQGLCVGILENNKKFHPKDVFLVSIENLNSMLESVDVVVFGFCKEMPTILNLCDFAICRSGASSLWELCANGLPALFIPYPYAAGNHQYYNAQFLEQKGLGFLCLEQNLFCDVLWDCLELSKDKITQMSQALQQECNQNATSLMCDAILNTLNKH